MEEVWASEACAAEEASVVGVAVAAVADRPREVQMALPVATPLKKANEAPVIGPVPI